MECEENEEEDHIEGCSKIILGLLARNPSKLSYGTCVGQECRVKVTDRTALRNVIHPTQTGCPPTTSLSLALSAETKNAFSQHEPVSGLGPKASMPAQSMYESPEPWRQSESSRHAVSPASQLRNDAGLWLCYESDVEHARVLSDCNVLAAKRTELEL